MEKLIIPSEQIYPFMYECEKINRIQVLQVLVKQLCGLDDLKNFSLEELEILAGKYDFLQVPPVPVFSLPEAFQKNNWRYILPDGNKRWLYGHVTVGKVYAILFGEDEQISPEDAGITPFRHMHHSQLFFRTLQIYKYQQNIAHE